MECVNEVKYVVKGKSRCEKIVRQHYLRDDIACGLRKCATCNQTNLPLIGKTQYAMFDHTVLLNQIDALQTESLTDFIIPQTALNYVANNSKSIYKKVRNIIANEDRAVFLFLNEFFRETYIIAQNEESNIHRDFRAYVTSVNWLNKHYSLNGSSVLFVTNSKELKEDYINAGIHAMTFIDFVEQYYPNDTTLRDRITDTITSQGTTVFYPNHLTKEEITRLISEKKLVQGSVRMNRFNFKEATVYTTEKEEILVSGLEDINRAVEGDIVALQLLPKDQWKKESHTINNDYEKNEKEINNTVHMDNAMEVEGKPTGKIVGIIKRNWKPLPGYIKQESSGSYSTNLLFLPTDKRFPPIRIKARDPAKLASQRILVLIDAWDTTSKYPTGHYVATLGNVGDKASETEAILELHEIPHYEFPEIVLKCLPVLPFEITEDYLKGRRDFRKENVCSIDPPGCTDIDDALHCKILPNGNYEIGVHIADVSCFVKPHTALDEEAAKRGTTVYLADRRIDMLPKPLTEVICSITQNTDTLTFSVVWELDKDANVINCTYHKGIVHSYRAYAYGQAQSVIDDKSNQSEYAQQLRAMLMLSKKLKQKRIDAGALMLASSEIKIEKDEQFNPIGVKEYQTYETNSMVEEYMLLANVWVAKKIYDAFPHCAMLRRHPPPDEHTFEWLANVLKHKGKSLDFSSSKALSESLDKCGTNEDPIIGKIMRILVTRCMQQAKYFSSGYFSYNEFRHYGLAAEIYTHFTSPIRRYADVMVHRLLAQAIGFDQIDLTMSKEKMKEIADNINHRHTMAQHAGRASTQMYTLIFLKDKEVAVDGYVIKVMKNGIIINIPQYGLEVIVLIDQKYGMVFDENENTLGNMNIKFGIFDKVKGILSIDKSNEFQLKPVLKLTQPHLE
ncbi:exosome complex exonuclease, putative [Entamoeba histolytica HM-1:IMSS-B]|uniref:Ribosomal RNA-processing protein 44 n=6 Tax=Entamoeba histolytica TaxID=5759 RepID=C4MAJ9_ENTH1|nr:exosome complex exonuclease, putative [Entamoeba histolytica HM-1:IMSS]EMD47488.1 exosome complex exonuclease, putative [Entamoeba histolytica KU27]EMH75666.1 exosome complex exonuclease, putative [Entamoeba histolytica HM-1:IMSS-B]EMS11184.1 exosome complex exonuclease RRP44, putative [Entamoeba histolytica HM-3:IMSS]ENY59807.1 exosome complex exonuclease RRP44, putative [Entamoeba histolytica HM-1:IMSS-A]GAT98839.1 exosome complex exonuclease putative [Entamoeba histolytica]|eukprot:XP_649075.1 exosome complex exonuclease, putative [Entamoeba histolytica HM-1:IMSS]